MTKYEATLRDILAELLELQASQVNIERTLAEQGVDSLIGLRFARRIHDVLGREVELEQLLDHPTIVALAGLLERPPAEA